MFCKEVGNRWASSWLECNGVSLSKLIRVVLVKGIDLESLKLPSRDVLSEENIELVKRAILGLRKSEVGPDEDDPSTAAPDESGVATEIPGLGIHKVVLKSATNDTADVVSVAGKADRLLSQTSGANLSR